MNDNGKVEFPNMTSVREVVYSTKHKAEIIDQPIADIDRDSLFIEVFEAARTYTMTPKERIYSLYCACRHVLETDIPGDFVECGVWRGGSSIAAALTFERIAGRSHGRRFFLYDTFEGMANPTDKDIDQYGIHANTYLEKYSDNGKWAYCNIDDVRANFAAAGVHNTELVFVKGCVEDTIPGQSPQSISVLRLDTDWYQSTLHELKHLWPKLSELGFCILDDYGYWRGSQLAVDEYFAREGLVFMHRIDQESRLIIKQRKNNWWRRTWQSKSKQPKNE
jgi:O-methyltransferase